MIHTVLVFFKIIIGSDGEGHKVDLHQYFGHKIVKFFSSSSNIIYIKLSRLDM